MSASPPPKVVWKAPGVVGKSVDEGGADGIELRYEGVVLARRAAGRRLESPRGRRKVTGVGQSCHVGVAGCVHGDPLAPFFPIAPEVGGVDESRAGGIELRHEG